MWIRIRIRNTAFYISGIHTFAFFQLTLLPDSPRPVAAMSRMVPRMVRTLALKLVGPAAPRPLRSPALRTPVLRTLRPLRTPALRTPALDRGLATSAGGALPATRLPESVGWRRK